MTPLPVFMKKPSIRINRRAAFILRYVTLFALSGVVIFGGVYSTTLYTASTQFAYVRGAIATSTPTSPTDSLSTIDTSSTVDALQSAASPSVATSTSYILHIPTPTQVRGIYMSQCVVGTPSFRDSLVKFVDDTKLNTIIIDVKDFSGGISFPSTNPELAPYVSKSCGAKDMQAFVHELHLKGIYVIGRVTTFQDPLHAKIHPEWAVQKKEGGVWKNYGGLAFMDVGAKPFWDYIVTLARVSHDEIGFDEINFDYIRFPSDGPLSDASFTYDVGKSKSEALEEFFHYLHGKMVESHITTSADMFGLVSSSADDLGIGQVLERGMPYFDFIDPMVYPSHYAKGFNNYSDVNAHPYDIIYAQMKAATTRAEATASPYNIIDSSKVVRETNTELVATTTTATSSKKAKTKKASPRASLVLYTKDAYPASKIRPWLQSFDYPVTYTPAMVSAQIKASEDAGLSSYIFWDAGNKYRSLKEVLR